MRHLPAATMICALSILELPFAPLQNLAALTNAATAVGGGAVATQNPPPDTPTVRETKRWLEANVFRLSSLFQPVYVGDPGRRLPAGGGGLRRPCTSGGTRPHSTWNSIVTRHVASTSSQEAQQGNSRAAQQGNSRAAEAPPWARGTPRHQHPLSGRASPHLRTARLVQVEARRAKRRHAQGGATSQVKASNTSERPAGRCHGPATFSFAYLVPPPHEYPRRSKTEPFVLSRS